jgi:hypothetical protein
MIDLEAIRARDAEESGTEAQIAVRYDRRALLGHINLIEQNERAMQRRLTEVLAYVDALLAERAELVSAGYAGKLQRQLDALREAAGKALLLLEYADDSDDCQYGTISTGTVRELLADLRKLLGEKP